MIPKLLNDETGYSLVEVMVAIMIMAIAIIPMVSMFDAGLRAAVLGSNYDQARVLAVGEMEEIKALNYGEAQDDYPPAGSPRSCTEPIDDAFGCEVETTYLSLNTTGKNTAEFESSGEPSGMMEVEVTVTWDENKSYSLTGLVAG